MKRYDMENVSKGWEPVYQMVEFDLGDWVRFEDVQAEIHALNNEITALKLERDALKKAGTFTELDFVRVGETLNSASVETTSPPMATIAAICHEISGTCAHILNSPHGPCTIENCSAVRGYLGSPKEPAAQLQPRPCPHGLVWITGDQHCRCVEPPVTNSPLAQAVLDKVVGTNLALFLTSAVDHIEKGGKIATAEVELTNGAKCEVRLWRIGSPEKWKLVRAEEPK